MTAGEVDKEIIEEAKWWARCYPETKGGLLAQALLQLVKEKGSEI